MNYIEISLNFAKFMILLKKHFLFYKTNDTKRYFYLSNRLEMSQNTDCIV